MCGQLDASVTLLPVKELPVENHEKPKSRYPVSGPRFQPWISRIQRRNLKHSSMSFHTVLGGVPDRVYTTSVPAVYGSVHFVYKYCACITPLTPVVGNDVCRI